MGTIESIVEILDVEVTGLYRLEMRRTRHALNIVDVVQFKPLDEERFEVWDASADRVIFVGKSRDEAYAFWFALMQDLLEGQRKSYKEGVFRGQEDIVYLDQPSLLDEILPGGQFENKEFKGVRVVFNSGDDELAHRDVWTLYIGGVPEVSAELSDDLLVLASAIMNGERIEKYTVPKGGSIWKLTT